MAKNLEIPAFKSCAPPTPFIEYGTGTSTKIDPNLPQTNEFSAYGVMPVDMTNASFKAGVIEVTDSFFTEIEGLKVGTPTPTADDIKSKIAAKLRGMFGEYIKPKNFPISVLVDEVDPKWVEICKSTGSYRDFDLHMIKVPQMQNNFVDYLGDVPFAEVVNKVNTEGVKPIVTLNYAQQSIVSYVVKPVARAATKPTLFIIEEYRMAAYLGKYGMGRVVKTFTLLPGEKTTITVKTYKDTTTTQTRSENVLDSYSVSSANELDKLVRGETDDKTDSKKSSDFNARLSLDGGFSKFATGFKVSTDLNLKTESSRSSNVKNLNQAIEKHVNNSNSNRQIQVNTTTTETTKFGEETSTVRELVNINKSRVLNFVFRQLHQQYITVTYLADIKVGYTNGNESEARIVSLEELRGMLTSVLTPASIDEVERNILKNYCIVYDYDDNPVKFIEKKTLYLGTCAGVVSNNLTSAATATAPVSRTPTGLDANVDREPVPAEHGGVIKFWRKMKRIVGTVPKADFGLEINVPGVILSVKESTLKTSSVLAEAILGQADALDCFNLKIQDAEAQKGYIDNTERLTRLQNEEWKARHDRAKQQQEIDMMKFQMKIISDLPDPIKRAEMYKKIFGTCCDTPQTVINH